MCFQLLRNHTSQPSRKSICQSFGEETPYDAFDSGETMQVLPRPWNNGSVLPSCTALSW